MPFAKIRKLAQRFFNNQSDTHNDTAQLNHYYPKATAGYDTGVLFANNKTPGPDMEKKREEEEEERSYQEIFLDDDKKKPEKKKPEKKQLRCNIL